MGITPGFCMKTLKGEGSLTLPVMPGTPPAGSRGGQGWTLPSHTVTPSPAEQKHFGPHGPPRPSSKPAAPLAGS